MANRFDWESRDRWEDERRNRMAGNDHARGGYSGEFGRDRWGRSGNTGAGAPRSYQSNDDMRGDRRTHDWEVGDRHYNHYSDRDQNETYGRSRWQDGQGNPSPSGADWFTSQDYGQGIGAWGGRTSYPSGGAGYGAGYSGRGAYRDDDPRGFVDRAVDEVRSWFGDDDAERRREQDHRGRGPSDYIRTDERIREDANDRLTDHPFIDARQISVSVTEGEVTLTGTVASRSDKRRAEDCVEDVSGVKHVQNNLRVSTTGATDSREEAREGGTLGWGVGGTPVA
ncbi:MAG: BON domain-containing protein [Novosphingobium sp.]|uniref:BON domain-containing protein n=1 Tax=Novosphingobium sp. TaxID=1874826 RepID=UPI003B9BEF54